MDYEIIEMNINYYDKIIEFWKSIEGLYNSAEDDSYDSLKIYLERNPKLNYIVLLNGKIIATIKCGNDGRRGYLHHLAVHKDHRNKGIAKKLISLCLEELKALGIKKCNLFVMDGNEAALEFWKHNNFKELVYNYRTLQIAISDKERHI
jgi:N-acetylglutamate synthase